MSFADVIDGLQSGEYVVTRAVAGSLDKGRWTPGTPDPDDAIDIVASVQPITGRDLKTLPEGRVAEDCRTVWTVTELRITDLITIEGEVFEVYRVKHWQAFDDEFYIGHASRQAAP